MASPESERVSLRPADIAGHRFATTRRGYDPEEVDGLLRAVAEHLSRLQGEIEWQQARVEHLERRAASTQDDAYARLSRDFMKAVRAADEATARVRQEAEAEARRSVVEAKQEAEAFLAKAREKAGRLVSDARRAADALIQKATLAALEAGEARVTDILPREAPEVTVADAPPPEPEPRFHPSIWRREDAARPGPGRSPAPPPEPSDEDLLDLQALDAVGSIEVFEFTAGHDTSAIWPAAPPGTDPLDDFVVPLSGSLFDLEDPDQPFGDR
jgi:DivIVA domain-containing protein